MCRILIVGGAGFIGSNLANYLVDSGNEVLVIDDCSRGKLSNLSDTVKFALKDVNTDPELWAVFFDFKPDWVFHYSAVVGVDLTWQNPDKVIWDIRGINRVFDLSRKCGCKKFIFASSSEVYGDNTNCHEEDELVLTTPYQIGKRFGELLCLVNDSIETYNLRFFNVYGKNQSEDFIMGKLLHMIKNKEKELSIYKRYSLRDYVYIEDNIKATLFLLNNTKGGTYNICTGVGTGILDLVKVVEKLFNYKFILDFKSNRDDIALRVGNNEKLVQLGFEFKYSLQEGLKRLI